MRTAALLGMLVAALTASACSVVVDDLTLPSCVEDTDCEQLNLHHHATVPATCTRWSCVSGRCVALPLVARTGFPVPSESRRATMVTERGASVLYGTGSSASLVVATESVPSPISLVGLETCKRTLTADDPCTFDAGAVAAASPSAAIIAMVDVTARPGGCTDGVLRIGVVDEATPEQHTLPQSTGRSTIAYGVDTGIGECTGATRAPGTPRGASAPALATLTTDVTAQMIPQALVAWRAGPRCSGGTCSPADVELIGVWLERMGGETWVSATGSGVPGDGIRRSVGPLTVGAAPPAVLGLSREHTPGYVVAYARDGGGIAAMFVSAFPDPGVIVDGTSRACDPPDRTRCVVGDGELRESSLLTPLGTAATLFASRSGIDHVKLVEWREHIAMIWQEGGELELAVLHVDDVGTFSAGEASPIASAVDPGSASIATITERFSAFAEWNVVWTEGGAARARRFHAPDGAPLDAIALPLGGAALEAPIVFGERRMIREGAGANARNVARTLPRVLAYDTSQAALVVLPGLCGAL